MQLLNQAKDQLVRPQKTTLQEAAGELTNQSVCVGTGLAHAFSATKAEGRMSLLLARRYSLHRCQRR